MCQAGATTRLVMGLSTTDFLLVLLIVFSTTQASVAPDQASQNSLRYLQSSPHLDTRIRIPCIFVPTINGVSRKSTGDAA